MRVIDSIVLHTAGAVRKGRAVHQTAGTIRHYHQLAQDKGGKGWRDIGYHWYVEQDGTGQRGRDESTPGAHVKGFNTHSLGLCVSGHGDYERWNPEQINEVVRKCAEWCRTFNLSAAAVMGHHEADEHGAPAVYKSCPGKLIDLHAVRRMVGEDLDRAMPTPPLSLEDRVAELERKMELYGP